MSNPVPNRSARGCLTCKQRKKKCDESRPACNRCRESDFHCLGYDHLNIPKQASTSRHRRQRTAPAADTPTPLSSPDPIPDTLLALNETFTNIEFEVSQQVVDWRQNVQPISTIPRSMVVDAIEPENLSSLVVSQLGRLGSRVVFGPLPYQLETGLARLAQESQDVKRWSLYLGANLVRSLLEGTNQQHYIGWIDRFQRQITSTSVVQVLNTSDLENRLSCLQDLIYYTSMILDGRASYAILKQSLPVFLQLAAKYPDLWVAESSISIHQIINYQSYEMRKFVLWDTVIAAAFGTAPLLHYDTSFREPPQVSDLNHLRILEHSYGCPRDIIVMFAKVNSWRVSRWIVHEDGELDEWSEVEGRLKLWSPAMDADLSSNVVARFAVQESWRQAMYIYLYMGMCRVDSSDSRVEAAVRQIVQLANSIEPGNPLEIHLCMPCLIAGVAARQEPHRTLIRKKIDISRNENVWCLRGADFVPVLDHLWHSLGAGGTAVTWEDYVASRWVVLPVE